MSLQVNEQALDKALHRIPVLIHELQMVEKHLVELKMELTKAVEDEDC